MKRPKSVAYSELPVNLIQTINYPLLIKLTIYLRLYSPFVGPWPIYQFLNPTYSR
jgi:hypothetical protein